MADADEATGDAKADKLDLSAIVVLVAPLVATIGLFKATGTIGRLQRDDPESLILAVSAVLAAGIFLTIASYLNSAKKGTGRKIAVIAFSATGVVACVIGFAVAVFAVIENSDEQPRPQIVASLNPAETLLKARVSSSNLATEDRLEIKVDLARLRKNKTINKQHPFAPGGSLPLQRSFVGPDDEGNVVQEISLPLPQERRYTDVVIKAFSSSNNRSCTDQYAAGTACVFLSLNRDRGHPRAKRWGR